jgi:hypothetical protein
MVIDNVFAKNFLAFLVLAKKNTYASNGEFSEKKLNDGTRELTFENNTFKYRDNYFGFNPFIGEEIVWYNKKPIWGMNYAGKVFDKSFSEEIYCFLKKALSVVTEKSPFRGPDYIKNQDLEYVNEYSGDYTNFVGKEIIKKNGKIIYFLNYHGSFIIEK